MRVIDVGVSLKGLRRNPNSIVPNFGTWGDTSDPAEVLLFDRSYIRIDGVRASAFYGYTEYTPGGDAKVARQGLKPIKVGYDGFRDYQNYANVIVSPLFGLNPYAPPVKERGVIHVDLPEGMYPAGRELYRRQKRFPYCGAAVNQFDKSWSPSQTSIHVTTLGSDYGIIQTDIGPQPYADFFIEQTGSVSCHAADIDMVLKHPPVGWVFEDHSLGIRGWGHSYAGTEGPFTFQQRVNGFSASYVTYHQNPGYYLIKVERNVSVSARIIGSRNTPWYQPLGGRLRVELIARYSDTIWYYTRHGATWVPASNVPQGDVSSHEVKIDAGQVFALSTAYEDDEVPDRVAVLNFLEQQKTYVTSLGHDIRPASAISSADAIAKLQSESNYVEAAFEAGQLVDLSEGILAAVAGSRVTEQEIRRSMVIGRVAAGAGQLKDINGRMLGDFLYSLADGLADLRLQFSFGLLPTKEDAFELTSIVDRIKVYAEKLLHSWSARGSHKFVANDDGRELTVVVRSKLVFGPLTTDGMSVFSRADVSGALPTPSRIWNGLKYTFLIDYVSQVGNRMRVVELYLAALFMGFWYAVHSFEVSYEVDYEDDGYVGDGGGPILVRGYIREASRFMSDPARETKFNFMPPRPPSVSVFLALLWKLFAGFFVQFW